MKHLAATLFACLSTPLWACNAPVCLVDPDSLPLTQVITFEDTLSSYGPGYQVDDLLVQKGARFGEHFAGQLIGRQGDHDLVQGPAFGPLTLMPGAPGENLSVVFFSGISVLNGYGPAGFPRRNGQGEGAIAVMFDEDQAALAFDLRGGENGAAHVSFLRRDGSLIGEVDVIPTGEFAVGFTRAGGVSDIAGIVVNNTDPQGLAIDTLRFGIPPELS